MLSLTRTEIKKVFSSRLILTLFAVLFAANCWLSYTTSKPYVSTEGAVNAYEHILSAPDEAAAYYSDLEEFFIENIRQGELELPSVYDPKAQRDDLSSLSDAYERLDYIQGHEKQIEGIVRTAENRIQDLYMYGYGDNSYEVRQQKKIIEQYSGIQNVLSENSEYAYGYDKYFSQTTPAILIAVVTAVITSYVFLNDSSSGFTNILRTTVNGRSKTAAAKIIASLFLCTAVSLLFLASSFASVGIACGYSSISMPIQVFPSYYSVPYDVTVLQYLLIDTLLALVGYAVWSMTVAAASTLCGSYIGGFAVGAVFALMNVLVYLREYAGTAHPSKYLNLTSMVIGDNLTLFYRSVSFFGFPLSYPAAMLVLSGLIIAVFSALCVIFSGKYRVSRKKTVVGNFIKLKPNHPKIRKPASYPLTLWRYELAKCRFPVFLAVFAVLIAAKAVYLDATVDSMERYSEAVYYSYISGMQDMDKAERAEYLTAERSRIDGILDRYGEEKAKFDAGETPSEDYGEYLDAYYDAQSADTIFRRVENYVRYIERKNAALSADEKPIYTTGYEKLFSDNADWFAFAALLVLCINTFTVEYAKNSSNAGSSVIIRAAKKGRMATFLAKTVTFSLIGGAVMLSFRAVDSIVISEKYILPDTDAALYCVQIFDKLTSGVTIGQYLALDLLTRLLAGVTLSLLICLFSYIGKRILTSLSITVVTMAIPEILVMTVFRTHPEVSLLTFTCPHRLLYSYTAGFFANIGAEMCWCAIAATVIFIAAAVVCGTYSRIKIF